MKNWVDEQKLVTSDKIAEWKAKRETTKLQNRADKAERYAAATIDVAVAALDEAERSKPGSRGLTPTPNEQLVPMP